MIFGSIYLRPGSLWEEGCAVFLQDLALWLLQQRWPYVIGGDWNASPQEVRDSLFPRQARGVVIASGNTTCTQSSVGTEIDFSW